MIDAAQVGLQVETVGFVFEAEGMPETEDEVPVRGSVVGEPVVYERSLKGPGFCQAEFCSQACCQSVGAGSVTAVESGGRIEEEQGLVVAVIAEEDD